MCLSTGNVLECCSEQPTMNDRKRIQQSKAPTLASKAEVETTNCRQGTSRSKAGGIPSGVSASPAWDSNPSWPLNTSRFNNLSLTQTSIHAADCHGAVESTQTEAHPGKDHLYTLISSPDPGGPYSRMPRGGLTPMVLNSAGCLRGSSTSSLICAICLRTPPTSS